MRLNVGPRCEVHAQLDKLIVDNFAKYFSDIYVPNSHQRAASLYDEYCERRRNYFGFPMPTDWEFDTELISNVITELKLGRASDLDGLTAEHLIRAHPILPVILSKLFRLILLCRHVPAGFRYSYIVPIPKSSDSTTKSMTCEDFRGIAISPVVSKVFEYCLIEKCGEFLSTDHCQFGFKTGIGCNEAIFTVRKTVERYIKSGNTVNLCAIDLSKAFDKVNHHALFIKLMDRNLPVALLEILEHWLKTVFLRSNGTVLFPTFFLLLLESGKVLFYLHYYSPYT